jgi:hypothetical protein
MTLTDDERTLLTALLDLASANVKVSAERSGLKVKACTTALDGLREASKPRAANRVGAKSKLTAEVRATILDALRQGAYEHVAAKAAGVDVSTLKRWRASDAPQHRAFRAEVDQALAEARVKMERVAFCEAKTSGEALAWLRVGPGRDRGEDEPGWTDPTQKHEHKHDVNARVAFTDDVAKILADPGATTRLLDAVQGQTIQAAPATLNGNGNGVAH